MSPEFPNDNSQLHGGENPYHLPPVTSTRRALPLWPRHTSAVAPGPSIQLPFPQPALPPILEVLPPFIRDAVSYFEQELSRTHSGWPEPVLAPASLDSLAPIPPPVDPEADPFVVDLIRLVAPFLEHTQRSAQNQVQPQGTFC